MINSLRETLWSGDYKAGLNYADELLTTDLPLVKFNQVIFLKSQLLYQLNRFNEALETIRMTTTDNLSTKDRLNVELRQEIERIEIYRKLGNIDRAKTCLDRCCKLLESVDNLDPMTEHRLHFVKGNFEIFRGNQDQALQSHKISLTIAEQLQNKYIISNSYNNLGIVYYDRGDLELAHHYLEQALKLRKEIGNKIFQAQSLNNLGLISDDRGHLDDALEYYKDSLKIYKKAGSDFDIASAYNNIAGILKIKGESSVALDYYLNAKEHYEKVGNEHYIAITYHNLASILFDTGELEKAKEFLNIAITMREQVFIAESYFMLLRIYLTEGTREEIEVISQKLGLLAEKSQSQRVLVHNQIAQALVLKTVPSSKSRIKSQLMLEDIIKMEIDYRLVAVALINLVELQIIELKLYNQESILDEIKDITNKLYQIAQDQKNIKLIVQVLILMSQIRIIEDKIDMAENILNQALILAKEHSLEILLEQIEIERSKLRDNIKRYREIVRNSQLSERIEKLEIEEYIENVKSNVDK